MFLTCVVPRVTETSCNNWAEKRKRQQGKTARKGFGWENKGTGFRTKNYRCAESGEG